MKFILLIDRICRRWKLQLWICIWSWRTNGTSLYCSQELCTMLVDTKILAIPKVTKYRQRLAKVNAIHLKALTNKYFDFRTKMYLDSSIPSRQKIYKDFLSNNNWKKYKKYIIEDFVQQHPVFNATTILDVPIICRVEEGL